MTGTPLTLKDRAGITVFEGTSSGGGSSPLLIARQRLTHAQILALPTTPIELVPTPGPDKLLWPSDALLYSDTTAGGYTGISTGSELGVGLVFPGDALTFLQDGKGNGDVYNILSYGGLALANCGPLSAIVQDAADPTVYPWAYDGSTWADLPLKLFSTNQDMGNPLNFGGGNVANFMVVAVRYSIIDLAA